MHSNAAGVRELIVRELEFSSVQFMCCEPSLKSSASHTGSYGGANLRFSSPQPDTDLGVRWIRG